MQVWSENIDFCLTSLDVGLDTSEWEDILLLQVFTSSPYKIVFWLGCYYLSEVQFSL